MNIFEKKFEEKIQSVLGNKDPAHDILHVQRVVETAKKISQLEGADLNIVLPAAWLHDIVNLPKDHPERSRASALASEAALKFLESIEYPREYFEGISHAILSHSFSAKITPHTIEAQVLQDADRLDALGAIGLARLFSISTQMQRPFYSSEDPLCESRIPDDKKFAIDHIKIKLEKIVGQMNTASAKKEAMRRFIFIENFLKQLGTEI